jgi:hypothetical protein
MRELRNGGCLAQKAGAKRWVSRIVWTDHFQRGFTAKGAQLFGAVHFGHATATNALDYFIGSESRAF